MMNLTKKILAAALVMMMVLSMAGAAQAASFRFPSAVFHLPPIKVRPTATPEPTTEPTAEPTADPTAEPTAAPTADPTAEPTAAPTAEPTAAPTAEPTAEPTAAPTAEPTPAPSEEPEEILPDDEEIRLTLAERLNPDRRIEIYLETPEDELFFGREATIAAALYGYENAVYTVQWQTSQDGEHWMEIPDATDTRLTVVVTEENYLNYWRIQITITDVLEGTSVVE